MVYLVAIMVVAVTVCGRQGISHLLLLVNDVDVDIGNFLLTY